MARVLQVAVAILVSWVAVHLWVSPLLTPRPDPRPPGPVDPVDPRKEPDFAGYDTEVYKHVVKVKSKTRKADCAQLSGDMKLIIDRIEGGEITDNQSVVNELARALRKLPMSWYGQVREIADKVLTPLTTDGTLSTPQRWAKLLTIARRGVDRAGSESTGVEAE